MVISIKDIFKIFGVILVCFCAVFICSIFVNYALDLKDIENLVAEGSRAFYNAQMTTSKAVCGISGLCLILTSVVLLCFYVGLYIENHSKELGILKALGYSRMKISKGFFSYGLSILLGTSLGYGGASIIMPKIYEIQNEDGYLPDFSPSFHPVLCVCMIVIPAIFFGIVAIVYCYKKLGISSMDLLKERHRVKIKRAKRVKDCSFIIALKKSVLRQKKSLVFFIAFAAFCFSAMIQMAAGMNEYASTTMAAMILIIGVTLAYVILFIAVASIIRGNGKSVIMMKTIGYENSVCSSAIFGGYRKWAYLGFCLGTGYQYAIMKFMTTIVFKDISDLAEYSFKVVPMLISLGVFVVSYEFIMCIYRNKIAKMPIKEVMSE